MEDMVSQWTGEIVAYVVGFVSAWVKQIMAYLKSWFEDNAPDGDEDMPEDEGAA